MSEQAAEQDQIQDDQVQDEVQEQHESPQNDDKPNTAEDVARAGGWKPLEEWEGDPAEWRSAEVFNERGEWIQRHKAQQKQIDEMNSSFNTRMENANKLHQQQMEMQKADLVRKRDAAIDLADRDAANGFQDDIDKLNNQVIDAAPVNNDQAILDKWNNSNTWILQDTPKAAYAVQKFNAYQSKGMGVEAAIAATENDVNREFPAINPERDKQPIPEGGSKPGKKRAARKLTMADLTNEELKYYRAMPGAWKSEADYLQAVRDTRGES